MRNLREKLLHSFLAMCACSVKSIAECSERHCVPLEEVKVLEVRQCSNLWLQETIKMCSFRFWHLFANVVLEVELREKEEKRKWCGERFRDHVIVTYIHAYIIRPVLVWVTEEEPERLSYQRLCLPDHSRAVTWRSLILHTGTERCWWLCFHSTACSWLEVNRCEREGPGRERKRGEEGSYLAVCRWSIETLLSWVTSPFESIGRRRID